MVINMKCNDRKIKRVLIGLESSGDILCWNTFERLRLNPYNLESFKGSLVGFSREHVQVKGYTTLQTLFVLRENAKMIKVRYLIVDTPSSYNIIIGLHALNLLGASLSTLYLSMKYLLPNVCIGVMQEDQETSCKCYHDILKN